MESVWKSCGPGSHTLCCNQRGSLKSKCLSVLCFSFGCLFFFPLNAFDWASLQVTIVPITWYFFYYPHLPYPCCHLSLQLKTHPQNSPVTAVFIFMNSFPGLEHTHPCFYAVAVMLHTPFSISSLHLTPDRKYFSTIQDISFIVTVLNENFLSWLSLIYSSLPLLQKTFYFILLEIMLHWISSYPWLFWK